MATATPSRKTQKKAEELRISSIGDIKGRLGGIMELPSGVVVRLKNPGGLRAFMANGIIPNSLMKVIQDALDVNEGNEKPKQSQAEQVRELTKDPEALKAMTEMMDSIAQAAIVEPPVYPYPPEGEARDPERLYPDDFDDLDKQFIFQWIQGGVKDLATFHQRFEANMATLSAGQGSSNGAKSDTGADAG